MSDHHQDQMISPPSRCRALQRGIGFSLVALLGALVLPVGASLAQAPQAQTPQSQPSPPAAARTAPTNPSHAVLDTDLRLFISWFEGRFDNERQVFFADDLQTPADHRHERIHSIFKKVDLPAFGEHVFYVEQYLDGDPIKIYRQRIYVLRPDYEANRIKLDIHTPPDPAAIVGAYRNPALLAGLTPANSPTPSPGCAVYWRRQENQFIGATRGDECRVVSSRSGRTLIIKDDLLLTEHALWIHDRAETETGDYVYGNRAGVPHQLRKVRMFECWTAVLRGADHGDSGAGAAPNAWFFQRGVLLHDQGGLATVTTDETPARNLRFRLRRVEWPSGTNRPSLTLYVLGQDSDRAVSYAWADYDADRLGINLRWMQASCTEAPNRIWDL